MTPSATWECAAHQRCAIQQAAREETWNRPQSRRTHRTNSPMIFCAGPMKSPNSFLASAAAGAKCTTLRGVRAYPCSGWAGALRKNEHVAGHRMVPTHATKAGIRYRYYVSAPFLYGEAKTASAGSISRVPAAEIEDTVRKSIKEHLATRQDSSITNAVRLQDPDLTHDHPNCCARGQAGHPTETRSR
jgi:hypothetical protein